jgi:hypothetical protein
MILADDPFDPSAGAVPAAMNLGGDIPTEDASIKHGNAFESRDSGSGFQHGFVGYDD